MSVINARFAQKGRVYAAIRAMLGVAPIIPPVVTQPPMPPAAVTVTPSHLVNVVVWSITNDADTYTVLRSEVSGGPYTQVVAGVTSSFWADYSVTAGVEYFYVVKSVSTQAGPGESSVQASGVPLNMLPGAFTYSLEAGVSQIRILLTSTSVGSTYYDVKVGDVEGSATLIASLGEGEFPFINSALTVDVPRKYWVYARNTYGSRSSSSNPQIETPHDIPYPTAPVFTLTALNSAVRVNLTGVSVGATSYTLKTGDIEGSATEVAVLIESAFPYTIASQPNGVPLKCWVYANNARGATGATINGQTSTPVAPEVVIAPPGSFSFTLTPGDNVVTVALSPESTGADYYQIWTGTYGQVDWMQRGGNLTAGNFPYDITGTLVVNGVSLKVFLSSFNKNGTQVTQATGNPKTATPDDGKPGAFTFTAVAGEEVVTISLVTPSVDATSYKIKRDTVEIDGSVLVGEFPYSDTTMTNNVLHSYEVIAVNAFGEMPASNNPRSATPWSLGLSYLANTISWDAADSSKIVKFSGAQAIDEWRSKNSNAIYFDGTLFTTSCVHTADTNSVDASSSIPTSLVCVGLDLVAPYTLGMYLWYPSDCPVNGLAMGLGYQYAVLFRAAGTDSITFAGPGGLYANYSVAAGALRGSWVRVVVSVEADKRTAKLRVNGVEVASDIATVDLSNIYALALNASSGSSATPTNVKARRVAVIGQLLTGQDLADFESILLDGEGSEVTPPPPPDTTISKNHVDIHAWVDPREPLADLTGQSWKSNTLGSLQDISTWTEPGARAPQDGVDLMTRVSAPNNQAGMAFLQRLRQINPATGGALWRAGFYTDASNKNLAHGTKYIEAFGFRFTSECLSSSQREMSIYEHSTGPDGGAWQFQPGFVIYLRTNSPGPRLEFYVRSSIDGLQASSIGSIIATVNVVADRWYLFTHRFLESADLTVGPYNRIWMAEDNGAITQICNSALRNCRASPPAPSPWSILSNEAFQYYSWNAGVTQRNMYSTGVHAFKDRGGLPTLDEFTLIAQLRDMVKPTDATPPELDPWTDPRCEMVFDANRDFSQHQSNLEYITGKAVGYGSANGLINSIPSSGLQVDASTRRVLTRVNGTTWSPSKNHFSLQLDETLPLYGNDNGVGTIRISMGRSDYSANVTNNGIAHWNLFDYTVTRSMYADMSSFGSNPADFAIHGCHHISWGVNNGTIGLTPFSGFLVNRADRTGMHFFYRVRSTTDITGTAAFDQQHTLPWSTPAVNSGTLNTSQDLYLTDAQGQNVLITEGMNIKIVSRFKFGWEKGTGPDGNGPVFEYWAQINNAPVRKIARWTGPVGHRLTDMSHQLRAATLYNWFVAFAASPSLAFNRSPTGIMTANNLGMRTFTTTSLSFQDITSAGRPDITVDRLIAFANRA